MNIPTTKEETEAILKKSFAYYESIGTKVDSNYLVDYWQQQLNLRKDLFYNEFDNENWRQILVCCKTMVRYSESITADVFSRYLPTTEMHKQMNLLFSDGVEIKGIHHPKKIDINHYIVNDSFQLPIFEIKSAQEHKDRPVVQTLFSLFGEPNDT